MGQRHQLFLVARVRKTAGGPEEYRCVAAFHHQWCYGKLPLHCVNRFKHLARVKENAALVRRDLDRYHEGVEHNSDTPCPYISFLAGSAFSTSVGHERGEITYFSHISRLSASMGSMQDNNDGITVIDISTPENPSYCFVSFCGLEGCDQPKRCVPLTARDVQTIPANSACGNFLDGYSFMFFTADIWNLNVGNDARLKGFNYGIVLPDGKNEIVDIARFFEHLDQEGWPKPKNGEAAKRLLEKFNEETGPRLLKYLGAAMKEIRSRW